jgi:2-dehydropantoate 2-reductase
MVRDVEAKRLTEIDALNGAVIDLGQRHNVPTMLNETMLALVKGRESLY